MLRKAKALAASVLIAVTLYFGAITYKAEEDADDEESPPINALYDVNASYGAITAEATKRKYKRSYDALTAKAVEHARKVEAERQAALKAERERLAARKKALKAANERRQAKPKPQVAQAKQPPSRGQAYVGRAQSFQATAYTAYCAGCSGITATGHNLRQSIYSGGRRVIAVDPRVIPLGSIVKITLGNGQSFEAVALDTGGAIKGNIVDVAHDSKDAMRQFGRQTITLQMIRKGR